MHLHAVAMRLLHHFGQDVGGRRELRIPGEEPRRIDRVAAPDHLGQQHVEPGRRQLRDQGPDLGNGLRNRVGVKQHAPGFDRSRGHHQQRALAQRVVRQIRPERGALRVAPERAEQVRLIEVGLAEREARRRAIQRGVEAGFPGGLDIAFDAGGLALEQIDSVAQRALRGLCGGRNLERGQAQPRGRDGGREQAAAHRAPHDPQVTGLFRRNAVTGHTYLVKFCNSGTLPGMSCSPATPAPRRGLQAGQGCPAPSHGRHSGGVRGGGTPPRRL